MKKLSIFLFFIVAVLSSVSAQIPNASFEAWDTFTHYMAPADWDNMNNLTSNLNLNTCTAGYPGTSGASFLRLTTINVTSMGIIPGIASPGRLNKADVNFPLPLSGFPYTDRPVYLSGFWQYMASGADQGYISVLLSHWDSADHKRDTIASFHYKVPGMVMLWNAFNIPLVYQNAAMPDSAIIILSASGLVSAAGSYLYVDQLAFTDVALTGIHDPDMALTGISIYPSPAHDRLTVAATAAGAPDILSIRLIDMTGRSVYEISGDNSRTYTFATDRVAKGTYIIKLQTEEGYAVRKVLIE